MSDGASHALEQAGPHSDVLVINTFVFQAPRCALGILVFCLPVHAHVVAGTFKYLLIFATSYPLWGAFFIWPCTCGCVPHAILLLLG